MAEVRWTPQAAEDLDAIANRIAEDSPTYARLFVMDVFTAVDRTARFPQSGRIVPETQDPSVRETVLGNYRIIYRLKPTTIEVLTIYHGARLLDPFRLKQE